MTLPFAILATLTLAGGIAALSLRNLVHCALSLVVALGGLAGLYWHLGAQFVGLAQVLVYVGAVAILIVFAILLTRGDGKPPSRVHPRVWLPGVVLALFVFVVFAAVIASSAKLGSLTATASFTQPGVKQIGDKLMTDFVLPLEVIALLLTAATIGAVIIALREEVRK